LIWLLIRSIDRQEERTPLIWTVLIFSLSFIGLGLIVFPYIIPTKITIYQAAAAPSALVFMLTFVGVLIPIMLFYNIYNYVVFRGKVVTASHE
jgi:cytochrome bd ubiquinol oxidase subunit II